MLEQRAGYASGPVTGVTWRGAGVRFRDLRPCIDARRPECQGECMRAPRLGLLLLVTLIACPSCQSLFGGPPDEFWRWQDDEPIGRVRHVRTVREPDSPIHNIPRVSYARASSFFTWEGGSAEFEFWPAGVHRSAKGRECFRWERVD
jgi:hypothetical protein